MKKRFRRRCNKQRARTVFITLDDSGNSSIAYIEQEQLPLYDRYFKAHEVLPPDICSWPSDLVVQAAREKAAVLSTSTEEQQLLEAILYLGHLPCDAAFHALSQFSQRNHALATTAGIAMGECVSMKKAGADSAVRQARC